MLNEEIMTTSETAEVFLTLHRTVPCEFEYPGELEDPEDLEDPLEPGVRLLLVKTQ